MSEKFLTNYFWFQINLSFKCNFRCPYCYVEGDRTDELIMSKRNMDRIVDYAKLLIDKYGMKEFRVNFLGGEPLLTLGAVLYISREFNNLPCKISLRVFTNGSLLTDDIAKRLSDLGIFIELSLNRTPREIMYEMCDIVSKVQRFVRIAFILDSYNLYRSSSITDAFLRHGWFVKYALENNSFSDPKFIDDAIEKILKILFWCDSYIKNPRHFHTLFDKIDPIVDLDSGYVYGRNMVCFDPDGKVRTMNSVKGAYLGVLGDSLDYISVLRNHPDLGVKIPRWQRNGIEECENCEIGSVCQGGYPAPKWHAYGRFDKPSPYCKVFKKTIPKLIEIYRRKCEDIKYSVSDLTGDLRKKN